MRYVFGDYVLDARRYELRRGGTPIKLRPKVFDVLAYLIAHRERVVAKQELLEQLWPRQFIGDATLNSCIMEARQAVGDTGQAQRIIQTRYGRGYRFIAAVELPGEEAPTLEPVAASTDPRDLGSLAHGYLGAAAGTVAAPEAPGHAAAPGSATTARAPAQPGRTPGSPWAGERKTITVLCCALANATGLAEALGPDAMHGLMQGFLALARREIQRYAGTILQYRGDGFMALFGAPVAHEDHARRGALAAVGLQRRLREQGPGLGHTSGEALAVCIGLHTGSVVVGGMADDGGQLFTAVGHTTQLATHLQYMAGPGAILLSEAMSRLLAGYVNVEPFRHLPTTDSKAPAPVYTLIGLAAERSSVAQRSGRGLSLFVGRQQELTTLYTLLAQAESGQGQVVGMVGEAGLGKSRLLDEFRHRLQGKSVTYLEARCLSYGRNTPYLPVLDLLQHYCGIAGTDSPATILMKVRSALEEVGMDPEAEASLLLQLLGVPAGTEALAMLSPETIKMRTFTTLHQLSLHVSRQRPLILAVEDLHWIDATSEEWLVSLVARLTNASILLLTTYRPGYRPLWMDKSYATQMALPRLTRQESQSVVQSALQPAPVADAVLQAILGKGAGNPFFLEELACTALESRKHGPTLAVPDTVQAVLAARIDRLPPEAKQLLQTAAVIGIDVPGSLLQAIVAWPEETVRHELSYLQAAEFLYETRPFPEVDYRFKHALTHEVAYGSLLQERRRRLHARIMEALEAFDADRMAEQVERCAHHALQGEVWDKALLYSRQAADKAMARSAFREAVAYIEQALTALPHLPEEPDVLAQAIDLRLMLDNALLALGAPGERGVDALRQAETLAEALEDQRRLGQICYAMSHHCWRMGAHDTAVAYGQRALAMSTASGDVFQQARANGHLGTFYFTRGDYRRAIEVLRRSIAALEGELRHMRPGMMVASVRSRVWLAECLGELGEFAEGTAYAAEAVRIAEAAAHPSSTIFAQLRLGRLALRQGDFQRAIPILEHTLAQCRAADVPLFLSGSTEALGQAYALAGRIAEALPLLEQVMVSEDTAFGGNAMMTRLGDAYLLAGRLAAAIPLAEHAVVLARDRQERGHQAWALRLLGEIAAHRHPPDVEAADSSYRQALALAEALGMRPLQAHCHHGLGTLFRRIGWLEQARAELSAAIVLYRAMDMTFWQRPAETALAQLGPHEAAHSAKRR